jgi:hypothetical protein
MKKIIIASFFISQISIAQKQIITQEQTWFGYISQFRIADKWSVTADTHLRTKNNFHQDLSTGVLRAGIIYHLNDAVHLAAGHAFFNAFPADGHAKTSRPEHRPWQQVQWLTRYSKLRLQQRLRLEERFRRKVKDEDELDNGYNFNYRARYQIMLSYPLSKQPFYARTLSLYGGQELLLNFGKQIVYNALDHNRLHLGLTYHFNKDDNLQLGYLNIFQQQSSGVRYRMVHVARIYFHHQFDLRKRSMLVN